MNIVWKETDYKNYFVSNNGIIRHYNKILNGCINNGYIYINFPKGKREYVHRLVAKAFIKNQNNLPCVNHKDGDKSNNNVNNLEWCSYLFNNKHSIIKLKNQGYKGKGNILCIETGDVFESSQDIKRKTGIFPQSVLSVLNGKTKTAFGYHWKRTNLQTTNVDCSKYRKKYGWKARLAKELGISRSCLHQRLKAGWNMSKIKKTTVVLIFFLALAGCARKDPVENIVDNHSEHFAQVLDYAYNNMEQNSDIVMLENELDSCIVVLDTVKEAHFSQIDKCEVEKDYWKLASFSLFVLLAVGAFAKIKKII